MKLHASIEGRDQTVELEQDGDEIRLSSADGWELSAEAIEVRPGLFSLLIGDQVIDVAVEPEPGGAVNVWRGGKRRRVELRDPRRWTGGSGRAGGGPSVVSAAMPGKVIEVLVAVGDEVETGQGLLVVEAMKMQNEIKSPRSGRVAAVAVDPGGSVDPGEALITIE